MSSEDERARRVDALGALAGRMAHDFNNVLGGVLGNAQLALMDAEGEQADVLGEIVAVGRHGRDLIARVLEFVHGNVVNRRSFDLTTVTAEAIAEARTRGPEISIGTRPGSGLPPVPGDADQVRRAVRHLVANAIQAVGGEGSVTVSMRRFDPAEIDHPGLVEGEYLVVRVEDDGPGIPDDHLEHVLEPFFGTGQKEGRPGLGLAVADRVARAHGGCVHVETGPAGTTASLVLRSRETEA